MCGRVYEDRVWGSMIKQTLKHRRPGFNESNYGFRSFSDLLQDAADRGFLKMAMDERSGGYVILAIQRDD
ncbi:MAG: OST-HTH/LOTUS domain-containing protein [Candidatus Latescibacterota bacterium]|nr:OST-HTH/LOTUS domain-containing protein [Candidatus Latescibacterota bacterium]